MVYRPSRKSLHSSTKRETKFLNFSYGVKMTVLCSECFKRFDIAFARQFPNKEYSYQLVSYFLHCKLCGKTATYGIINIKVSDVDDIMKGNVGDMVVK